MKKHVKMQGVDWKDGHKIIVWKSPYSKCWCGFMVDENGKKISGTGARDAVDKEDVIDEIIARFNNGFASLAFWIVN
jgi:hypothetical protein